MGFAATVGEAVEKAGFAGGGGAGCAGCCCDGSAATAAEERHFCVKFFGWWFRICDVSGWFLEVV